MNEQQYGPSKAEATWGIGWTDTDKMANSNHNQDSCQFLKGVMGDEAMVDGNFGLFPRGEDVFDEVASVSSTGTLQEMRNISRLDSLSDLTSLEAHYSRKMY